MAERAGRRGRFKKLAGGNPNPSRDGFAAAKEPKSGAVAIRSNFSSEGEDGNPGDDETGSCSEWRDVSGESERRFLFW